MGEGLIQKGQPQVLSGGSSFRVPAPILAELQSATAVQPALWGEGGAGGLRAGVDLWRCRNSQSTAGLSGTT